MKCNVGGAEKSARIIFGVVFLLAALFVPMHVGWRVTLFFLSGLSFLTAFSGYCPLNQLLHINTCRREPQEQTVKDTP